MFKNEIKKQKELIDKIKGVWENEHAEEISEAYNNIVAILATLDMYSANMLVNLLWLQTAQKSYVATVGKKEVEVR
jgi:hypothetical protein